MNNLAIILLATAAMTACSAERGNVIGSVGNSSETFTGEIKNYTSDKGKLILTSSTGTGCSGDFDHKSENIAVGTLSCTDGRSGNFTLNTDDDGGSGYGNLNNEAIKFGFSERE